MNILKLIKAVIFNLSFNLFHRLNVDLTKKLELGTLETREYHVVKRKQFAIYRHLSNAMGMDHIISWNMPGWRTRIHLFFRFKTTINKFPPEYHLHDYKLCIHHQGSCKDSIIMIPTNISCSSKIKKLYYASFYASSMQNTWFNIDKRGL